MDDNISQDDVRANYSAVDKEDSRQFVKYVDTVESTKPETQADFPELSIYMIQKIRNNYMLYGPNNLVVNLRRLKGLSDVSVCNNIIFIGDDPKYSIIMKNNKIKLMEIKDAEYEDNNIDDVLTKKKSKAQIAGVQEVMNRVEESENHPLQNFEVGGLIGKVDTEAVDIVLSKCPLKKMGKEVDISVYEPPPPVSFCTIEVTGPCSVVCEDHIEILEMYFETERRSGGDNIESIRFDSENNMVLVTFESDEVAKRVVDRGIHKVKKMDLGVALHIPSKTLEKSKKKDIYEQEEKPEPPNMIKVKGVDKDVLRDDTLEYYFQNTRRSGGGEIQGIKSDEEDDDVIYISFKDNIVAENVVKRSHMLHGKLLNVSLYTPDVESLPYKN